MKITKVFHKLTVAALVMLLLQSCYKDHSTYDYASINEIKIIDTTTPDFIYINAGDMLTIDPIIHQSVHQSEANLSFEWMIYDNSASANLNATRMVIDTTRNLKKLIEYPFILGQRYKLTYKVKDNNTKITTYHFYQIEIVNKFSRGWVFLEEHADGADFSMVLPDGEIVHDLYSSLNGLRLPGKARRVEISTFSVIDDVSVPSRKMYVLTDQNTVELNYLNLLKKYDLAALFYAPPATVNVSALKWYPSPAGMAVAINNNKANVNLVGGFPGAKKFGQVLMTPEENYDYALSNYMVSGNSYPVVLYDKTKKRFLNIAGTGTKLSAFPETASEEFDLNNTNMDMLYFATSNTFNQHHAVMRADNGEVYYLRLKTLITALQPKVTMEKKIMDAPEIASATAFGSSPIAPHIYYSTDNKIRLYEVNSNTSRIAYEFPTAEKVTLLYIPAPTFDAPMVMAVTYDGQQSRVYKFYMSNIGEISTYEEKYEGFKKIVDINYR